MAMASLAPYVSLRIQTDREADRFMMAEEQEKSFRNFYGLCILCVWKFGIPSFIEWKSFIVADNIALF